MKANDQSFRTVAHIDAIRSHGHEIESRANDVEILLTAIIDKIDSSYSDPLALVSTVDCFARQALANIEKLKEHRDDLVHAVRERGDA